MAHDYVIVCQVDTEAKPVWTESLVGRSLLKSAPVRVIPLVNKIAYWESNGQITRRVNITA